jgi:hypothetical protein
MRPTDQNTEPGISTKNVATLPLATHQRDIAGTRAHQPTAFLGSDKRAAGAHGMAEINGGEFGHWPWRRWRIKAGMEIEIRTQMMHGNFARKTIPIEAQGALLLHMWGNRTPGVAIRKASNRRRLERPT